MANPSELLAELVAIASVNPMGRPSVYGEAAESPLTDFLERYFKRLGIAAVRQTAEPGRENIIARLDSTGAAPGDRPLVFFEAHQDTVPAAAETIAPWTPEIRGRRLYGRGSCDVKGGMAAMLSAVSRLHQERPRHMPAVVVGCTVNEEFGFTGAKAILELWRQQSNAMYPRRPDCAIVAEPTELDVVVAHKGLVRWRCHTLGRAAHSASPQSGENAIYRMAQALVAIERYAGEIVGTLAHHPLCGRPTLSVGTITGGLSVNTVPDRATIEIDRRLVPGEEPEPAQRHLIDYLQREARLGPSLTHESPFITCVPLSESHNGALADRLIHSASGVAGPRRAVGVAYGTDAAWYASAGVPTVVFGPGSIAQAHTADEWIDLDQLDQAAEIYYRFVKSFC